MRKVILYIAVSLDGNIARSDGGVDWLHKVLNPDKNDYGYMDMYHSIDTTLMGNTTYQEIVGMGVKFPYPDKKNYVFTTNTKLANTANKDVHFIGENPVEFVQSLKQAAGKGIWLIGGAKIASILLAQKIIDELLVFVMPIAIGDGISLFTQLPQDQLLELIDSKSYASGVVRLRYRPA